MFRSNQEVALYTMRLLHINERHGPMDTENSNKINRILDQPEVMMSRNDASTAFVIAEISFTLHNN